MRRISIFLLFFIFSTFLISSHEDEKITIEEVIIEIRDTLNLKSYEKIDPIKVPDKLLEKLGEAIMTNNENEGEFHNDLHNDLGGVDSDASKFAHRAMGFNYLKRLYNTEK